MNKVRWLAGAALACMVAGAHADWYIVYSPVLAKHSGRSTYCCFPTRAACEEARARHLQPNDSIGCQGFDSPSAKAPKPNKGNGAEQQRAKQEKAKKARAEQQKREEEAQFRRDKGETLGKLKGVDGSGSASGELTLKSAPPANSALHQLKNDAAWSRSAAQAGSDEQARDEAERGAQGAGGIKHLPDAVVPDVPPPTPVPGH